MLCCDDWEKMKVGFFFFYQRISYYYYYLVPTSYYVWRYLATVPRLRVRTRLIDGEIQSFYF